MTANSLRHPRDYPGNLSSINYWTGYPSKIAGHFVLYFKKPCKKTPQNDDVLFYDINSYNSKLKAGADVGFYKEVWQTGLASTFPPLDRWMAAVTPLYPTLKH